MLQNPQCHINSTVTRPLMLQDIHCHRYSNLKDLYWQRMSNVAGLPLLQHLTSLKDLLCYRLSTTTEPPMSKQLYYCRTYTGKKIPLYKYLQCHSTSTVS